MSKRFGGIFDVDVKARRLLEVNRELAQPAVWDTPEQAQALSQERTQLESVINEITGLATQLGEAVEMIALAAEEGDDSLLQSVEADVASCVTAVDRLEFCRMFSGKMDKNAAYLEIQSGSGGTEAQDWAEMLLRMYLRWATSINSTPRCWKSPLAMWLVKLRFSLRGLCFWWLRTETRCID